MGLVSFSLFTYTTLTKMKSCVIALLVLTFLLICIRNVVGPKNKGKAKQQEWRSITDFAAAGEIEMNSGPSNSRPQERVGSSNGRRSPTDENYQKDYKCLYEHYFPFLRILETYKTSFPGIEKLSITVYWWPTKEISDLYARKKPENIAVGDEYNAYRAMGTAISTAYSHLLTVTFVSPNSQSAMLFETELFKLCTSIQSDPTCSKNYKDTMLLRRTLAMSYRRLRGANNLKNKFDANCPTVDVTSADEGMR